MMAPNAYTRFPPRKLRRNVAALLLCCSIFLLSWNVCDGRLAGREDAPEIDFVGYPRGNFHPLKCNDRLDNEPCVTPFSKAFGNHEVFQDVVEIPCGKCIVMYPSKKQKPFTFSAGLRILGKLVIHPNDIRTTSLLVHGELTIESMKPIDGTPDISITWIDAPFNETLSFRAPPDNGQGSNNNEICGGERGACGLGRKPLVVAGGKLNIRGLPSPSMPTWVKLYDVDKSAPTTGTGGARANSDASSTIDRIYKPPKSGCPQDDILIHHNYLTSSLSGIFRASYGSISEWTSNGGLKISNRSHSQHCPVVDLKYIRDCLEEDKTYLLTAKLLLTKDGEVDQSDCARGKGEDHCMSIYQARMSGRGTGRTSSLWKERQSFQSMIGEETTIAIEVNFTSQQLGESNIYEIIQLRGPGPGVDMELLEFTLRAPPREAFPEPEDLCNNLVPANGNAELLGLSPYPFRTNHEDTYLSVVTEGSNQYFEVTGREFAIQNARRGGWKNAGITWELPTSCMKSHSKYVFHAEIRMHSLSPASSQWKVKASFPGKKKSMTMVIANCPKSMGTWVGCEGSFEPSFELLDAERLEVFLEGDMAASDVDYDVDDISFRREERPFDRLILPKSIENLWAVGSEILITSHSTKWDGHETRKIASIENHDDEGYVSVGLNETIDRPLTLGLHPSYATEVALLSRNIVFNGGNGAHLTILKTPGRDQVIQGVDLIGFGEESVHQSYPIHFDSCKDSTNSIVSKNTIRQSGQRCLVIDETDNVLVEGNIAFGNKGHCFVVESGTETGNIFKSNLAAFGQKARAILSTSDYKGKETDDTPSMFWIGSPSNRWIDNLVAGSEGFGFWFQPKNHRDSLYRSSFAESPHLMPLTGFTGNVVHSANEESLKITGYNPVKTASIDNFKSYLSNKGHIFVSTSTNIAAYDTLLDTPLASHPFAMRGTIIIQVHPDGVDEEESSVFDSDEEVIHHQSFSDPTDVFNLQSSPSLMEEI